MKKISIYTIVVFFYLSSYGQADSSINRQWDEAKLAIEQGKYDRALDIYKKSLSQIEETSGKQNPQYLSGLTRLANLYGYIDQYDHAFEGHQEVLTLAEQLLGEDHPDYLIYLNNLAVWYHQMGQYDEALKRYKETVARTEKTLGKDNAHYGNRLRALAAMYRILGHHDKALPMFQEALYILERRLGKSSTSYTSCLNSLAVLYMEKGQYENALPLYREVLENTLVQYGAQHPEYAFYLDNLGSLYTKMGRYDKALPLFISALEINESTLGKDHLNNASYLDHIAAIYKETGQYDKAEAMYLRAIEITKNSVGPNHARYGTYLSNLSTLYQTTEKYDKASALLEEALENTVKSLGKGHPNYGTLLNGLASLYRNTAQRDKVLPLYVEALKNTKRSLGEDHAAYGIGLFNLATWHEEIGQYDQALSLHLQSLENARRNLGENHSEYGTSLNYVAQLYHKIARHDDASPSYTAALNNLRTQISQNFAFLSAAEKTRFIRDNEDLFDIYQSFFYDYSHGNLHAGENAYDIELFIKGLMLSSSQQMRKAITDSNDSTVLALYDEWFIKNTMIAQEFSKPISEQDDRLLTWQNEAENLEKKLISYSNLSTVETRVGKAGWEDVQQSLKVGEVAVEFSYFHYWDGMQWTGDVYYTAILLRKGDLHPRIIPLFEHDELATVLFVDGSNESAASHLYRGAIAESTNQNLSKLYHLIWKPLEGYIDEGQTVYFAPTGMLHQIAFAAIQDTQGIYISDRYHLKQVNSTATILQQTNTSSIEDITLFGGIEYGTGSWLDLPGTLTEVKNIQAQQSSINITTYTGPAATEEAIKSLKGRESPSILHIATHGFFFPAPEEENANLKAATGGDVFKWSTNSLNRTGLLFAGANITWDNGRRVDDREDGILTAYEASHISLPNTALVVLSACETGLGDIKGSEGVFGLQRAFKAAGANYLLMSLWQVPDKETAEFMEEFYQNLFSNRNIEESFVETQRHMKTKYPDDPYSWAGFVLTR